MLEMCSDIKNNAMYDEEVTSSSDESIDTETTTYIYNKDRHSSSDETNDDELYQNYNMWLHRKKTPKEMHKLKCNLIKLVKNFPILYLRKYLDKRKFLKKRMEAWNMVAKMLKMDADACRKTWICLKNGLCRALSQNNEEIRKGDRAAGSAPDWKYYKQLRYLVPHLAFKGSSVKKGERRKKPILEDGGTIMIDDDDDDELETLNEKISETVTNVGNDHKFICIKNVRSLPDNNISSDELAQSIDNKENLEAVLAIQNVGDDSKNGVGNTFSESELCGEKSNGVCIASASKQSRKTDIWLKNPFETHPELEERLLGLIKMHPDLFAYDGRSPAVRENRKQAWENISETLGVSDELCMHRWAFLKRTFLEALRLPLYNNTLTPETIKRKKWLLLNMKFLLPHTRAHFVRCNMDKLTQLIDETNGETGEKSDKSVQDQEDVITISEEEEDNYSQNGLLESLSYRQMNDGDDDLSCYTNFFSGVRTD